MRLWRAREVLWAFADYFTSNLWQISGHVINRHEITDIASGSWPLRSGPMPWARFERNMHSCPYLVYIAKTCFCNIASTQEIYIDKGPMEDSVIAEKFSKHDSTQSHAISPRLYLLHRKLPFWRDETPQYVSHDSSSLRSTFHTLSAQKSINCHNQKNRRKQSGRSLPYGKFNLNSPCEYLLACQSRSSNRLVCLDRCLIA